MQQAHLNTLDMVRRVQGFLDRYAATLGILIPAKLRARLDRAATQLAGFQVEQAAATGTARGTELRKPFPVGTKLEAKVIEIDPRRGEVKLSIKALHEETERTAYKQYRDQVKQEAKFGTLGDLLATDLADYFTDVPNPAPYSALPVATQTASEEGSRIADLLERTDQSGPDADVERSAALIDLSRRADRLAQERTSMGAQQYHHAQTALYHAALHVLGSVHHE